MVKLVLPQPVLFILRQLQTHGFEAFVVGGAVRDILLDRPTTDWDFTTNATPEEIMTVFTHHFYDNVYGTVGLPIDGLLKEMNQHGLHGDETFLGDKTGNDRIIDVTTYRIDVSYSDNRRPDEVRWGKTLEDDLSRRDFTINALALRASDSSDEIEIIDLYGGQEDLKHKLIRAVGDPSSRFQEDALRMMRAIRFGAQLGFSIEEKTLLAIKDNSHRISAVSAERVRDELLKILKSNYPSEGITLLYNSGLLAHVLPETLAMKGVKQGGHHIYDVWTHSLEALKGCPSSDPIVRLATFLHDIGKPITIRYQGPRGVTFYGHEVVGARLVRKIGERLKLPQASIVRLETLVRWHMFVYNREMTDGSIRRFIRNVGLDNINDMMLLRVGDRKGGGSKATSWRLTELQKRIGEQLYEPMSLKDLEVKGQDVMETLNLSPSRKVGEILDQLFEEVLDDSSKNNRDYLLKRITELG